MSNYEKETAIWVTMWIFVTLFICTTVFLSIHMYNDRLKTMAENGYCETPVLGSHSTYWQKCKKGD